MRDVVGIVMIVVVDEGVLYDAGRMVGLISVAGHLIRAGLTDPSPWTLGSVLADNVMR